MKKTILLMAVLMGSAVLGVAQESIKARVIAVTDDTVTVEVRNPPGGATVSGLKFFVGSQNDLYQNLCPKSLMLPGYTRTFVVGQLGSRQCDENIPAGWELSCGTDHWLTVTAWNDSSNHTEAIFFTTDPCP